MTSKTDPAMRAVESLLLHLPIDFNSITPEHRLVVSQIIRRETRCDELLASVEAYVAMMRHSIREPRDASSAAYQKWQQRYHELCEDAHDKARAALGLEDTQ